MRKGAMRTRVILAVAFTMTLSMTGRADVSQSGDVAYTKNDSQLLSRFEDANAHCEKARKLFAKKDLSGTRQALEDSLRLFPELAEAHLLMAKVFYIENNFEQALLEVILAKNGHLSTATLLQRMQQDRMTWLRERRQEKEETISELRARLATVPAEQKQQVQLQIYRVEKDKDEIDRMLYGTTPTANQIPAEYFFFHGNVLLRLKDYTEAAAQYDEALKSNPGYGDAANNLASLYFTTGEYEKALAVVKGVETHGVLVNPELKKAIQDALRQHN